MLPFNSLLERAGLEPNDVAVILHTPTEPRVKRVMAWWASERPALFNTYQNNHSRNPEVTLKNRTYAASFVNMGNRTFLFVGLYRNKGGTFETYEAMDQREDFKALFANSDLVPFLKQGRDPADGRIIFDLANDDVLDDLRGRLRVAAPAASRPYIRKAENLDLEIVALSDTPFAASDVSDWRNLTLTKAELLALPLTWTVALSQWRGIYLIVDEADGARYVGSAYGSTNLYGRWIEHVKGERGVTVELQRRDTVKFRFSILQRVSPDMEPHDVQLLEQSWKLRLHTLEFGLNRN